MRDASRGDIRIILTAITMSLLAAVTIVPLMHASRQSQHTMINGFTLDSSQPHHIALKNITPHNDKDSVPAIHEPQFVAISEVSQLDDSALGVLIDHAGEQRFYPHSILAWHEVVNDSFGNDMIAVIFCPRTETGAAFYRQAGDTTLRFSVSGLRYDATSLLYDHGTETLWLGIRGLGAVGELSGVQLQEMKTQTLDAGTVREHYPLATTLTTDTGFDRNYKINPFKE